jgi:hypothetical protein
MKKLLLVLLMAALLLAAAAIPASAADEDPLPRPDPFPEISAAARAALGPLGPEQARALEAFELFIRTLNMDVNTMRFIYPDSFAGIWIRGENLHIALTSDGADFMAWYYGTDIKVFAGYEDVIIYETEGFNYSYNTLLGLRDIAAAALHGHDFPLVSAYVNVYTNKVVLEFSDSFLDSAVRNILIEAADTILTREEAYDVFVLAESRGFAAPPTMPNETPLHEENPKSGIFHGLSVILIAGGLTIISRKKK